MRLGLDSVLGQSSRRRRVGLAVAAWVLCAVVLAVAALLQLPDETPSEEAAALGTALAAFALAGDSAEPQAGPRVKVAEVERRLAELRRRADERGLQTAALQALASRWQAAGPDGRAAAARELMPAAAAVSQAWREQIRTEARLWLWAVQGLLVLLAVLPLLLLHGLSRQRQQVKEALSQFSDDLGSGHWQDAVHSLRHEPQGPPSAFDALAQGVAGVMGETDRRWQALADLSADWYWETDASHALTRLFGSTAVFEGLGWQQEDLLGWRHDQIPFFRLRAPGGWAALDAAFRAGQPFRDLEFEILSRDRRSLRWVAISGRARRDSRDEFAGYEGVGRDITERKRAHARLQASEQRWAAMASLAADWYWESDDQHRLMPLAADVRERLGHLVSMAEGRAPWEAYPDALDAAQWQAHRAVLQALQPFRSLELRVAPPSGDTAWISLSGVPRHSSAGRFLGYHGVGRDVTARKAAERVLRQHNESLQRAVDERTRELQAVNRDLEAFARQLAHELRTPIGQIQGLAQLLQSRAAQRLAEEDRKVLDMQLKAAAGMRDTVEALLVMARSTLQPMDRETLDLSALAQEVIASLPPVERHSAVTWAVQPGIRVGGSAAPLRIVLVNLLSNAAKFTRLCESPRIALTAAPEGTGMLRVAVQDNGVGFDPQQASRLFTPFSRLHDAQRYAGTGIGLTIVQRIVERHGGSVRAMSQPGEGARFEFTLPVAKAQEAPGKPKKTSAAA